jgi:hypothetical protein
VSGTDTGYFEWDLTQHIAQLRTNGAYYVSVMLRNISGSGDNLVTFYSRENQTNKPELVIVTNPLITESKPAVVGERSATKTVVSSFGEDLSFTIYPNPVRNSFTLKYSPAFENRRLRIMDISGSLLQEVLLTESGIQTIRVDNLKDGLYFLNIDHNHKRYTRKIVVRR